MPSAALASTASHKSQSLSTNAEPGASPGSSIAWSRRKTSHASVFDGTSLCHLTPAGFSFRQVLRFPSEVRQWQALGRASRPLTVLGGALGSSFCAKQAAPVWRSHHVMPLPSLLRSRTGCNNSSSSRARRRRTGPFGTGSLSCEDSRGTGTWADWAAAMAGGGLRGRTEVRSCATEHPLFRCKAATAAASPAG